MIISYHGKQYFKIGQGDTTLSVNPVSKDNKLKLKLTKFSADIALSSVRHSDFNATENNEYNGKAPFIIQGPGSYEIGGNSFVGFQSVANAKIEGEEYINTVYFFTLEGISFCFLGNLSSPDLAVKIKEYTDLVDVIFVPVGGADTLDPIQASKIIKYFAPKVVIPMDYGADRDKGALEVFLKEMGSKAEPEEKYVFKKINCVKR